MEGQVRQQLGAESPWRPAKTGDSLPEGSQLRVGRGARAEIGFDDGSRLEMGPESEVVLQRTAPKGGAVRLAMGFLMAVIHKPSPSFEVRTPAAVLAVRGTRFSVAVASGGKTRVRVFSGAVSVKDKAGREATLGENQAVDVTAQGIGAIRATAAPTAVQDTHWTVEAPEGWQGANGSWKRAAAPRAASYRCLGEPQTGGLAAVERGTIKETESVRALIEDRPWTVGQPWPFDCRSLAAGQPIGSGAESRVHGKPTYSLTCGHPFKGGTVLGNRERFFLVAYDFDGTSARHMIELRYTHVVDFELGPRGRCNDLHFIGMPPPAGDRDGSGIASYQEMVRTLRPADETSERTPAAQPQQPAQGPDDNKAVPLLR
jgi:hypothetical protein